MSEYAHLLKSERGTEMYRVRHWIDGTQFESEDMRWEEAEALANKHHMNGYARLIVRAYQ